MNNEWIPDLHIQQRLCGYEQTFNYKWPNIIPKYLKYVKQTRINCPNNRLA